MSQPLTKFDDKLTKDVSKSALSSNQEILSLK